MTPAAIFSAVKDAVILIALAAFAYLLISYGKDTVKVSDIKGVEKQIQENAATVAKWQKESTDADTKHVQTLQQIGATIAQQRAPVFVRGQSCPNPMPSAAAKAGDTASPPRPVDQGRGIDYRPAINQFELKYETALADCYTALDKWPQ